MNKDLFCEVTSKIKLWITSLFWKFTFLFYPIFRFIWLEQSFLKALYQGRCKALKTMSDWIWFLKNEYKSWIFTIIFCFWGVVFFIYVLLFFFCQLEYYTFLQISTSPHPFVSVVLWQSSLSSLIAQFLPSGKTSIHHVRLHWFSSNRTYRSLLEFSLGSLKTSARQTGWGSRSGLIHWGSPTLK